jgi:multidrug resistance efflux pump
VNNNQQRREQLLAALDIKKRDLDRTQAEFERKQNLFKQGFVSAEDFDKSSSDVKLADAAAKEAGAQIPAFDEAAANEAKRISHELEVDNSHLAMLKAGSRPDLIEQKESEVTNLESIYDNLTAEIKKTDLVTDIGGIVLTERVEEKKGQHLERGDGLMEIADTSRVYAEMMVPEKELGDIHKGLRVVLTVNSFPADDFEGVVDSIAAKAGTVEGQQMIVVRAILSNGDGRLKPDFTGVAKIYCGQRRIIDLMTRRIRIWIKTEFWPLLP